jgi:probable DNA metabolism protein
LYCIWAFLSEKPAVEDVIFDVMNYGSKSYYNIMKDFQNEKCLANFSLKMLVVRSIEWKPYSVQLKDGIYFAKIDPDSDVLTLIIKHLKETGRRTKWIIYDLRRKYGVYYDLNDAEIVMMDLEHQIIG